MKSSITLNTPVKPDLQKLTSYLEQVHDNEWYTNFGPLHQQLTARLEAYLGVKNLLLVSNGTLAIQVACKVLNVKRALTTPFSFVATTSSLLWQGIETAFCDVESNSFNLSAKSLGQAFKSDSEYDAIVATHVYGNPCDVTALKEVANDYGAKLIYDAAHAFGVKLGGESILNFGDASTLSFHATKVFHTVEGGAIVFNDKANFEKAKQLINFGIRQDGSLGEPGINAKLNEYQCAVGLSILDQMDEIIEHRAALFSCYRDSLKGVVELPKWLDKSTFNGAYMPVVITNKDILEKVILALDTHGVQYRRYFSPSLDKVYKNTVSFGCPISNRVAGNVICLPLHYYLTFEDVSIIVKLIKDNVL